MAAATRTPFESARRVFVIEAVEHDERPGGQPDAEDARGAGRVRAPAAAHRPPRGRAADDRLALPARALRPAAAASASRRGSSGVDAERAPACARLALGDGACAARLASEAGAALRAPRRGVRARGAARVEGVASVDGRCSRPRETAGVRAGEEARRGAARARARARSRARAQALRARGARGAAARRAPRRAPRRSTCAAPGGAVAARRAVRVRGRCRARATPWTGSRSCRRTRTGAPRRAARARSSGSARHAPAACALNVSEELALEALAYRLQALLAQPAAV